MNTEIKFNPSLSSAATTQADVTLNQPAAGTPKKIAPLFGGKSLTVSFSGMSDLEALVAKLKNEQDKTKFSILITSLNSIGESLTAAQKTAVEEGLKLNEQLKTLNGKLAALNGTLSTAQQEAVLLQTQIDSLKTQIEQAVQDGKDHNELVAKQKELREELDAKNATIAETKGKISETKNEISSVNGKISAVVKSIGENTLKTIANEIADIARPEEATSNAEREKEEKHEEATSIFNSIHDSLENFARDLSENIERNVETMA